MVVGDFCFELEFFVWFMEEFYVGGDWSVELVQLQCVWLLCFIVCCVEDVGVVWCEECFVGVWDFIVEGGVCGQVVYVYGVQFVVFEVG